MERFLGELRVLQRLNQYEFEVEMDIMRDGPNDNGWDFRNIEEHYRSFAGTPILVAYIGRQVGDGHNSDTAYDMESGQEYQSYMGPTAERIVGMVSENLSDLSLVKRDGYTWIRAKGRIWRVYAPELVDKIVRTGRMDVSAETNVLEQFTENGIEVFTNFDGLGVTILGDYVKPAIPGANIRAMAALEQEFHTMQLRVASLRAEEENKPQKTKIETEVKKSMAVYLSKKELTPIQAKFGDKYTVLSAAQGENSVTVSLFRKKDMAFCAYELFERDKAIDEDNVKVCAARVVLESAAGEEIGCADACDMMECEMGDLNANASTAELAAKEATERAEKAEAALKEMQTRETARRIKASRDAAERQLSEINANRVEAERFEASLIDDIRANADNGTYAGCEDKDGNWTGEEAACAAVRDICMKKQMEMDKQKTEQARLSREKHYAWESDDSTSAGSGDWMSDFVNN